MVLAIVILHLSQSLQPVIKDQAHTSTVLNMINEEDDRLNEAHVDEDYDDVVEVDTNRKRKATTEEDKQTFKRKEREKKSTVWKFMTQLP